MDIGTFFTYRVSETLSDRNCIKIFEERYTLESSDGGTYVFSVHRDGVRRDDVTGYPGYGNGHIRMGALRIIGRETLDTEFGRIEADVYGPGRGFCGGDIKVYMRDDGIVCRYVEKQMWSGGVMFERRWALTGSSLLPRDR